jgi:hypothetical protein
MWPTTIGQYQLNAVYIPRVHYSLPGGGYIIRSIYLLCECTSGSTRKLMCSVKLKIILYSLATPARGHVLHFIGQGGNRSAQKTEQFVFQTAAVN